MQRNWCSLGSASQALGPCVCAITRNPSLISRARKAVSKLRLQQKSPCSSMAIVVMSFAMSYDGLSSSAIVCGAGGSCGRIRVYFC